LTIRIDSPMLMGPGGGCGSKEQGKITGGRKGGNWVLGEELDYYSVSGGRPPESQVGCQVEKERKGRKK